MYISNNKLYNDTLYENRGIYREYTVHPCQIMDHKQQRC